MRINSPLRIIIALLLFIGLPVFVWAVLTQRIELRKRAATSEPPVVCWDKVQVTGTALYWPDGCRGNPNPPGACTQALVELTATEVYNYTQWVNSGRPVIPGCGTPTPTPPQVAECGSCTTVAQCASGLVCQQVPISPTPTPYCPNGPAGPCTQPIVQGRGFLCVKPDGSSTCTTKPSPSPTPPVGCSYQQVQCFRAPCPPILVCQTPIPDARCTTNGTSCNVQVCPTPFPCPSGAECMQNYRGCYLSPGICQNNLCIAISATPTPTPPAPSCTMPPACAYAYPPCSYAVQGVTYCPIITPTPSPSPTPTPTPQITCSRNTPQVTLTPATQDGNPSATLTYALQVTNTDSIGCAPSLMALSYTVDTNFTGQLGYTTYTADPGTIATLNFFVTSPNVNPYGVTQLVPISVTATNTSSAISKTAPAAYRLLQPQPQPLTFRVKLAGVTTDAAQGATIRVTFYLRDGTVIPLSTPLVLTHIGNGVYQAQATLTNPLPAGTAFAVQIKGEKHIAVRFCRQSGQTAPCAFNEMMTPTSYDFDFTGRPLPPGDTNGDGRADATDVNTVTRLFTKTISQLTASDLAAADFNYSKTINNFDLNLILQTLGTRFDE